MQIETVPPGAAVVDSVKLGSVADQAGVNPGDIILAVNGRAINSAAGMQTDLTLGAPPSGP
jgi:S1-C subfamily serine protease